METEPEGRYIILFYRSFTVFPVNSSGLLGKMNSWLIQYQTYTVRSIYIWTLTHIFSALYATRTELKWNNQDEIEVRTLIQGVETKI